MGLFSSIGKLVGAAIGTTVGQPGLGAAVGGKVGGLADKKKKSASNSAEYIKPTTTPTMETPGAASRGKSRVEAMSEVDVKVAKVPGQQFILDDPWKPAKDWWEDLGGDPERVKKLNKEDMPL